MTDTEKLYYDMMKYITHFRKKYPSIPLDDLEDELSWSFFKAYRSFDDSRGVLFKTYFFNIAHNGCKALLRYRDYRKDIINAKSLEFINTEGDIFSEYYDYETLKSRQDEATEITKELLEKLRFFSKYLPPSGKQIIDLFLAGYSNKEICQMLGKQSNNISTQKVNALKKFTRAYKDEYPCLREYAITGNILNTMQEGINSR